MPGEQSPENQTPTETPAAAPAQVDVEALKAEFAKTQEQLKQAVTALAAMQAAQPPAPAQQEPQGPELDPDFRAKASHFFKTELAPFLQQIDQRMAQLGGWQNGQQLRQTAQEINLPSELENEAANLMAQYANAGRPISHQTAVRHILGIREENRLRQEAANQRAKTQFNSALMPAFTGGGGLPNLQPVNGQRPKDNDILGWAQLANQNDLPL